MISQIGLLSQSGPKLEEDPDQRSFREENGISLQTQFSYETGKV